MSDHGPRPDVSPSPETGGGLRNRLSTLVLLLLCASIGCYLPSSFSPFGGAAPMEAPVSTPAVVPHVIRPALPESLPGSTGTAGLTWQPGAAAHDWKYIVLHHTASESGSVDSIDRAHRERVDSDGNSWRGIGYHFVIGNGNGMADGEVQPTFRWLDQSAGAHAGDLEFNNHGIGICLVGNFEERPPTADQLAATKRLVAELKSVFGIEAGNVVRHGDVKATDCPGRYFPHDEVAVVTSARDGR